MKPVEFPQQTMVLAKDQPQYTPLPVHFDRDTGACIGCFELDDAERNAIAAGGNIWLWQYTFGHPFQPVSITTQNPWGAPPNTSKPSYDALLIIAQSVCGALARAGLQDCDDPGEAIDVIRERLENRVAELEADGRDAARYRWLRESAHTIAWNGYVEWNLLAADDREAFDAAVDKARAAAAPAFVRDASGEVICTCTHEQRCPMHGGAEG